MSLAWIQGRTRGIMKWGGKLWLNLKIIQLSHTSEPLATCGSTLAACPCLLYPSWQGLKFHSLEELGVGVTDFVSLAKFSWLVGAAYSSVEKVFSGLRWAYWANVCVCDSQSDVRGIKEWSEWSENRNGKWAKPPQVRQSTGSNKVAH